MKAWNLYFTPAGPTGDNFTTDGEVAPEDIIAGRILEMLRGDAKLVLIFGDAIELMETRPLYDFRSFPRLQIYTSSTTETQSPTSLDVDVMRVYVSVRFDALNVSVLEPYQAGIATLRKYIAKVLKATKSLKVKINGTVDVPLTMEMETGGTNWLWDASPAGDRVAGTLEMEFLFRVHVDHRTQRIDNLQKSLP